MEVAWKDAEVDCCAGRLNLCTFISATRCTKVCSHYTDKRRSMAGGSDGHVLVRRGKAQVVEYHFLDVKILFYLYYSPTYFLFRLMLLN